MATAKKKTASKKKVAAKTTKKVAAKKATSAEKASKPKASGGDSLLALPVNRTLNAALREARYVALSPKRPLFDSDFYDVWLFGKLAARRMKMRREEKIPAKHTLDRHLQGVLPSASAVAKDTKFVKDLAASLRGVLESSDIDVPYHPFAVYAPGWTKGDHFGLLWVGGFNMDLRIALASGETVQLTNITKRKLAFVTFDDDEDPADYYDPKELKALKTATDMLKAHCGAVHMLTLCEGKTGRAVPTYPVFYFGISALGNITGVFTLRCDT